MRRTFWQWHENCAKTQGPLLADFYLAIIVGFPFAIVMAPLIVFGGLVL
jgi:hypothetical protein